MLVVMALGGNALLRRGELLDVEVQRRNLLRAVTRAIAPVARRHQVVITHGNGPQIGLLALQAAAYKDVKPYPLDVLGAESEGMIGYLIGQSLANGLPGREIATLLTQVEVDPSDPAFDRPTKPIGPVYDEAEAQMLAARTSCILVRDGHGFRRAVPSPDPRRIHEIKTIRLLVRAGILVICAGGGGIPIVKNADGAIRGVEAVIDKDLSAALLAEEIGADALLLLTDVAAVWSRWPQSNGEPIRNTTPAQLRSSRLDPGSMGPKVEAACRFVERTGRTAGIGGPRNPPRTGPASAGADVRTAPPCAPAPCPGSGRAHSSPPAHNNPDPASTTSPQAPKVTVEGSAAAPFIYFDGVSTLDHFNGIMQIELAAQTRVPDRPGPKTEVVAVAHLRCTLSGLAALKDAIQKLETMLAPAEGKAN